MEENEEFDSDFNKEGVPISESFWKYMESYWHNHREFPESPEDQLKRKADLVGGKVPSSQLPSYVDDVLEFDSFENLPNPGEKGKIYVLVNNNSQYRWSGSEYIQLNSDEHFMTVNTNQGISGIKNFFTGGGNYAPFNNTLQIYADDGSLPSMTYSKGGSHVGQVMFDTNGFHFKNGDNDKYYHVKAQGFVKESSDDDYLLTGGGGHLNKYSKEDAWFHSSRNFLNGTLIETDIDYSGDYGHQFLLELKGNMYFDSLPLEAKIQGYIYNGTIIAQSGYSTLDYWNSITALNFNGKLCFWFPRMAYWQGFEIKVTVGYGGITQGKNRVSNVFDHSDPGGTKRVEIPLKHLLTKEELVSKNIFQPFGNYTTLDTDQTISGSKEYYSTMPFKLKRTDAKSWVFHKPANDNLIFAPSSSNNSEDWDWNNQITFNDSGTISTNGFVKNGSSNDYLLLGGGSHRLISDFALTTDLVNTHKLDYIDAINNGSSTRTNKSWFDYNWAETEKRGSVINFSGLNSNYSTELFGEYDNGGNKIGIRTKNGDTQIWNNVKWLWHADNLPQSHVEYLGYLASNGAATISWSDENYLNSNPLSILGINHDANNLNKSGFYSIGYETKNTGDYTSSKDGIRTLLHLETESIYSASQLQTERYNGNILSRTRADGVWSHWIRHWGNNDFTQNNIDNWNQTYNWGNHANAGYAGYDFVNESIERITAEHINPNYPVLAESKVNTIIITDEFGLEYLELASELIPQRQITIINLSPSDVNVRRENSQIDTVKSRETTEYYITAERRLIKKGSYQSADFLN